MNKTTFMIFALLSIGMIILSIYVIHHSFTVITTYEKAEGILVDYNEFEEKDDEGNKRILFSPVYAYYDLNGDQHTVDSGARSTTKKRPGSHTTVYYDKNYPADATASKFELYWVPVIAIFFTFICCITTYFLTKPDVIS